MNRIAMVRKESRLSQAEFGRIMNVAQNTVCAWEAGRRLPDIETFIKIADTFGVSLDYLVGRSEDGGTAVANGCNCTAAAGNARVTLNKSKSDSSMESDFITVYRNLDLRRKAKLITAAYELLEGQSGEKADE